MDIYISVFGYYDIKVQVKLNDAVISKMSQVNRN